MTSIAYTYRYTYRYPFASYLVGHTSVPSIQTATVDAKGTHPFLFRGRVLHPDEFGRCLSLLSKIVRTHFHLPLTPAMLDPVVTVADDAIRMEGFSGCCSVYARADFSHRSFDGKLLSTGTTNVDFGSQMQSALARVGIQEAVNLSIGSESFQLHTDDETVIERKVKLPIRWIKSFTEVQTLLPQLQPKLECDGIQTARLLKSFPSGPPPKNALYAIQSGSGVRLTTREKSGSVSVHGIHRVAVLEKLLPVTQRLKVYADDIQGNVGWEITGAASRFFLMISPRAYRGFSGEGANLSRIADASWEFSHRGYDVAQQQYFDRALPLDLSGVVKLQPRLKSAQKLFDADLVRIKTKLPDGQIDCLVQGTNTDHFVRLRNDNDACSCRWHSRYQGERGPCKHILAARILVEQEIES